MYETFQRMTFENQETDLEGNIRDWFHHFTYY